MPFQVTAFIETPVTNFALIGSLPIVYSEVNLQFTSSHKIFVAHFTLVFLKFVLQPLLCFAVRRITGIITFIWV